MSRGGWGAKPEKETRARGQRGGGTFAPRSLSGPSAGGKARNGFGALTHAPTHSITHGAHTGSKENKPASNSELAYTTPTTLPSFGNQEHCRALGGCKINHGMYKQRGSVDVTVLTDGSRPRRRRRAGWRRRTTAGSTRPASHRPAPQRDGRRMGTHPPSRPRGKEEHQRPPSWGTP